MENTEALGGTVSTDDMFKVKKQIIDLRSQKSHYCFDLSERLAKKKVADQVLWEAEDLASCKERP